MNPSTLNGDGIEERHGFVYEFSFWDFTVIPLLLVLLVMTLSKLWRKFQPFQVSSKLVKNTLGHKEVNPIEQCQSKDCVRCLSQTYSKEILIERLESIAVNRSIPKSKLSRLQRSIRSFRSSSTSPSKCFDELSLTQSQPTVLYVQDLNSSIWYSPSIHGKKLNILLKKTNFQHLINEFHGIFNISSWRINRTNSGVWKTFHLIDQGKVIEENCNWCPKTTSLIMGITSVMKNCTLGNVLFSVIYPGCNINLHTGASNARLRCHIPLVSNDNCHIIVGGEKRNWTVGEMLVFDDSYPHEVVYNAGDAKSFRAVLLLDIWHPFLTDIEQDVIQQLFAA